MKSRWYFATFVMIAGFIVILVVSGMIGNEAVTTLSEAFPKLQEAENFRGVLLINESSEEIPLLLTDDQYRTGILSSQIKEGKGEPSYPVISLEVTGEERKFSLLLGKNGIVSLTTGEEIRIFKDPAGNLFRGLYEEHLLSGGEGIPD